MRSLPCLLDTVGHCSQLLPHSTVIWIDGLDLAHSHFHAHACAQTHAPSGNPGVRALVPNVTNLQSFAAIANLIMPTRLGLSPSLSSVSHLFFWCVCVFAWLKCLGCLWLVYEADPRRRDEHISSGNIWNKCCHCTSDTLKLAHPNVQSQLFKLIRAQISSDCSSSSLSLSTRLIIKKHADEVKQLIIELEMRCKLL